MAEWIRTFSLKILLVQLKICMKGEIINTTPQHILENKNTNFVGCSQLYIYDKQKWYGNIIWVIWKTIFKIELLITKMFNNGFFLYNLILHSYSTIDSFCRTSLNFCFFRWAIILPPSSGNWLSSLTGISLERLWSERLLFKATEGLIWVFTSSNVFFVFLFRLCLFFLFLCLSFSGHFASCHSDSSNNLTSKNKYEKNLKCLI